MNLVDNRKPVQRVLWLTLWLNIFVMLLKAGIGIATNSLSLQADALHSLTDGASNVLGLFTMRLANPHPDRDHPYGHQKFEALGALGIAAFLGMACFEILQSAVERITQQSSQVKLSASELWLLLLVLGVNIFVTVYERREGIRLGSRILVADAYHTLSDIWVTIAVLTGLVGIWAFNWQWLDIALAFPVAGLVFYSGWRVLRGNIPWLVDEMAIAPEAIHQVVMGVPGVVNCHDIASRGLVGRQVFIEMHLIVETNSLEDAHEITEIIEARLQEVFPPARVMIHMEPQNYSSDQISYPET
ncbi:cation diffusion facilitator family transporter [Thermosynechococcaceae cyanobacterium BACA0444]|uniref:Cation diffusion facilitator family transporter n=1 Tax=Pseudocalidococcus azoricus BACA0444 TaxID=2918990 RepID=A0AAE4FPJ3_9CYAN|nr:cation diffusion facilitator family transporter [Pseudocalidococcus azoricus]MDS3859745.1 cation diffusion facilitator family transporter [Pseudocalidococcus azoricus BACA0444]